MVGRLGKKAAAMLGLRKGTIVAVGGFDQTCAALGSGAVQEGIASYGIGTVLCITAPFSRPIFNKHMLENGYTCGCHLSPKMYHTLADVYSGGSLLRWYRDELGIAEQMEAERKGCDVYSIITERAAESKQSVFVVPHFMGTGTPWRDPKTYGCILGLHLGTTRRDIALGILEGTTFEMAINLKRLHQAGIQIHELRVSGGGAKSQFWLQLTADITGKVCATTQVSEGGCYAAAILAGVGLGYFPSLEKAAEQLVGKKEIYEPNIIKTKAYAERLIIFEQIYPTLCEINHRINTLYHTLVQE